LHIGSAVTTDGYIMSSFFTYHGLMMLIAK